MTHFTDEQLAAYALDDLEAGTEGAVASHLEACAECRASLDEIRATLEEARQLEVPERGDDYGAAVWNAIEPRLSESRANEASHIGTPALQHRTPAHVLTRPGPWLAAAATITLVVGAYWLGRHDAVSGGATPAASMASAPSPGTEAIRERVVLAALGEHFDRTERTLVELVNSEPGRRVDISAEQAWARDLLEANRLYRQASAGATTPALSQVLDDLEPVLLEIANSPSQITSDEFEALRNRIEARSLVFKVRVTGADIRARQRALIRRGEAQS